MSRKNAKGGNRAVWFILSVVLIAGAVFAGFKAAVYLKDNSLKGSSSSGKDSSIADRDGAYTDSDVPGGAAVSEVLNRTPVTLVYVVNSETARIENIFVEILRCNDLAMDYIRLVPEISYTMSAELYQELAVDNTELPQTVTLAELYRYYYNDKAYEAGRRIISEMINFNVLYYSAIYDKDFSKYITVSGSGEDFRGSYAITREQALEDYGTKDSVKGILEAGLTDVVTNHPLGERLRYLDIYEQLDSEHTTFYDAPVIKKNETVTLSASGMGAILYGILY